MDKEQHEATLRDPVAFHKDGDITRQTLLSVSFFDASEDQQLCISDQMMHVRNFSSLELLANRANLLLCFCQNVAYNTAR
jgi:hypothetical protein